MRAVDLFAGAGGFSLGLARAGFEVVLANESSVDPELTYRYNLFPTSLSRKLPPRPEKCSRRERQEWRLEARDHVLRLRRSEDTEFEEIMRGGDIRHALSNEWLNRWVQMQREPVDVVVGGPPCQGFSCAGRLSDSDDRNDLVHEALRVIKVLKPRVAVIENVPGMLGRYEDIVRHVGESLSTVDADGTGYYVVADLVHSELLGVPQTRQRLLIVGVRRDLVDESAHQRLTSLLFPVSCPATRPRQPKMHGRSILTGKHLTTDLVMAGLASSPPLYGRCSSWISPYQATNVPDPNDRFFREVSSSRGTYLRGWVRSPSTDWSASRYGNHEASTHGAMVSERMRLLRAAALQSAAAKNHRCSSGWLRRQFSDKFPGLVTKKASQRVLLPDEWPMLTVTSLPDDIVHHREDRIPTVREMARLQTFPDWFEFMGVRTTGAERRRAGIFVPQYTQVANAVPPRLAHAVAARIRQFLELVENDPSCQFEPDGGFYVSPNIRGLAKERLDELNEAFLCAAKEQAKSVPAPIPCNSIPLAVGAP